MCDSSCCAAPNALICRNRRAGRRADRRWEGGAGAGPAASRGPLRARGDVSYTLQGTWRLLRRYGWSWQQPALRAVEHDDTAVELWKKDVWPRVKAPRRRSVPGSSRTRGRRGCTPVVRVRGRGSGRVSMAGMVCCRPGRRSRMFYAVREYRGRMGRP
ncbi:winged helix-turn-helix domain-containing protein [Streptomyces sp. NPDC057690]|uniref:winged helix-turn-helix domain-containing protein n=1 Tax=Streptomyces sp. NPDC057690 TaxID=3346214 RepID=UPI0036803433